MQHFSDFLDRKSRDNKNHLHILGKLFERVGFTVKSALDHHEDPYIYVFKPVNSEPILEGLSFGGIRIYTRGRDIVSFRPQNKSDVEPFGSAYLLDVKEMFKSLVEDDIKEEAVGRKLAKYIVQEVFNFFVKSLKAEKEDETGEIDDDSLGKLVGGNSNATDYANQVSGDLRRNN
jgi:hypothetical protein